MRNLDHTWHVQPRTHHPQTADAHQVHQDAVDENRQVAQEQVLGVRHAMEDVEDHVPDRVDEREDALREVEAETLPW